MIDGQTLGKNAIYGPYASSSGVTYTGVFGTLLAGAHTYVITATDKLGVTSTLSGQFTVPIQFPAIILPVDSGPRISAAAFSIAHGLMTWNEADLYGVAGRNFRSTGVRWARATSMGPMPTRPA